MWLMTTYRGLTHPCTRSRALTRQGAGGLEANRDPEGHAMAKKLACRLGRHEWTTSVEGGQTFKICAACGTTRDPRRSGSELEQSDMMGMSVILGGGVDEPRDALEQTKWTSGGGPGP